MSSQVYSVKSITSLDGLRELTPAWQDLWGRCIGKRTPFLDFDWVRLWAEHYQLDGLLRVLVVTGDHSTPSQLQSHSWHPVPFMLHSRCCRCGLVDAFGERELRKGELGTMSSTSVMPLALAHAGRLVKFGA